MGSCFFAFALAAACGNPEIPRSDGAFDSGGSGGNAGSAGSGTGAGLGSGGLVVPDGGDIDVIASALAFDPPAVTLVLDGSGAIEEAHYALIATFPDGSEREVTAQAIEFDRPDLASIEIGAPTVLKASGAMAGTGTLHGIYGGLEATATLTVNIVQREVGAGVPDEAVDELDMPGLPADPELQALLYPYDETVFALGLTSPLMMWDAPNAAGDVYRIRLEQEGYAYDLFQVVDAPAQVRVPQAVWDRITASNGGDPLTVTVSRWDAATKSAYTSAELSFTIAPESLRGAIYYWTASMVGSERQGNITRIYPGSGGTPEKLNEGRCMGCHSVSADGSTLVATVEDPSAPSEPPYGNWTNVRAWASFDLPEATLGIQTTKSGSNSALTPDGRYVVFGGRSDPLVPGSKYLSLAVTETGEVIPTSRLDEIVLESDDFGLMMPAFSIDGTKLAFVEAGGNLYDNVLPSPSNRIIYVDFDQSVPEVDPTVHEIARASDFPADNDQLGYPAFTPDSQWVAYHTGKYSTGCNELGCVDETPDNGELWISNVAGGEPIRLARLNDPPNPADRFVHREPTFCPVKRGGYSWVVFTSMRDWGNALTGPAINGKRRLWVAAIDGEIGTTDPSHPAFYIEGQENTPNMRGFWALAACIETPPPGETGQECTAGFECCSGFCVNSQCVDTAKLSCSGVGGPCAVAGDCCNAAATQCVDQVCRVAAPH